MIFSQFLNKTNKYLKSVRILKNYVSIDMDEFIKTNIEREEKEKLFKSKVQELKNIFEKEKLENLKGLKFDIEELTKFLENEEPKSTDRVAETTENV